METACGFCYVSYSHDEIQVFEKRLVSYNYETKCPPQYLLYTPYLKKPCFHCYVKKHCIRYWGGVLPTLEYELGVDGLILYGVSDSKIYTIDENYKMINQKDENGDIYSEVIIE